eukprot:c291_g1_i1.p1 GENE.c291_g1_i1~~c291_g1_i1.p1  ORF type:complete len:284 (-),score=61.12 c291_g1_i1:282-1076(-)
MDKREVSIIVPTYEEAMNVKPLCTRIFKAMKKANIEAELLLVDDDSGQGTLDTIKIVKALEKDYPIRIHIRKRTEGKGLSSAVLLGLQQARYSTFLVMDADLQHEPESAPSIVEPILSGKGDFAIGSRNTQGGKVQDWPLHRRIISGGATLIALPLANCSDPMSGFFALNRKTFCRARSLNPMGYKIGLELMVRCKCKRIVEVPITFRDREAGESKLTMKQNLLYLRHVAHLYWFAYPSAVIAVAALLVLVVFVLLRILLGLVR